MLVLKYLRAYWGSWCIHEAEVVLEPSQIAPS